jgi:tetratricopeptide (TPR) repeat protein
MRQRWPIPAAVRAARRCAACLLAVYLFFVAHLFYVALFAAQFLTVQVVGAQNPQIGRDRQILKIQGLIEHSNLPEAEKLLDNAVKQFPSDAGFDNLRGIIEAQQGDHAGAESSFRRAIQRSPKFTGAYLNLGRLYQESSAADPRTRSKALDVYARVLDYEPKNEEANYQSALLLLQQGMFQESLSHLSRLPEEVQGRAQALSIFCADYAAIGKRTAADDAAARLLADPEFSEADAQQIFPGLAAGNRDDLVIALLEGLRKRMELSPQALHALGSAYVRTHRLAEARAMLEKSATGENLSAGLLRELARVAREQRDYKGSLGYLAHARDLAPENAGIHYDFGLVCLDLELLAEAGNAFEKALKLEPENASFNYAMGSVAAFRHDPAEAVPFFQKYLQLKPDDPRGKLAIGTALFRAKDYDAAIPWLTEAVKAPETTTAAHYYLGAIALQQRRLEDAFGQLQLAVKAKPNYANALAELGQYYIMKKDYGAAETQIKHALEIDPDYLAANLYLLTLYTRTGDSRREAQAKHFEELQKLRDEKAQELMRIVEVRPFETP